MIIKIHLFLIRGTPITKDYLDNYFEMDQLVPYKLKHIIPKRRVIGLLDLQSKKDYEKSEYFNSFMTNMDSITTQEYF